MSEGLIDYITNNQEKVLLIFDGYDEYRSGCDSEIYEQNHPQYLSGLSRALFPTTFLKMAVYVYKCRKSPLNKIMHSIYAVV